MTTPHNSPDPSYFKRGGVYYFPLNVRGIEGVCDCGSIEE